MGRLPVAYEQVSDSNGNTDIAVAGTATVYTKSFRFGQSEYYSSVLKASSSGTINLKIELEISNTKPATEGAADDNYAVGENMSDVMSALTDSTIHFAEIQSVTAKYARFKVTGLTGNDSSTTINLKFGRQDEV